MNRYSVSSLRFWTSDAPAWLRRSDNLSIKVDEIAVLIIEYLDFARFPGKRQASSTAKQIHPVSVKPCTPSTP